MGEWGVRAVYTLTEKTGYAAPPGHERFSHFVAVPLARSMETLLHNRSAQGVRNFTFPTKQAAEECAKTADPTTVPNTRYHDRIYIKCVRQ